MRAWMPLVLVLVGCGSGTDAYRPCDAPEDCEVPEGEEAVCLDKAEQGFCSLECGEDSDCEGVDEDEFDYVCASFESEAAMYCFPACAQDAEEGEECPGDLTCRSTGGGSDNRKMCFPD